MVAFLTIPLAVTMFAFLKTVGTAYSILRFSQFAEQVEASEYLDEPNKPAMRLMKLYCIITALILSQSMPIAIIFGAVYLTHFTFLKRFDQTANPTEYNLLVKKFWRWYIPALFIAVAATFLTSYFLLASYHIIDLSLLSSAAGIIVPGVMYLLKKVIPQHSWAGKLLYGFDALLAKWSPVLLPLFSPANTSLAVLAWNYLVGFALVYQPIIDSINYFLYKTVSFNILSIVNNIFRSRYMPNFLKNLYNRWGGKYYDELKAFNDYTKKPQLSKQELKELIDKNNTALFAPAVENLYLYKLKTALKEFSPEEAQTKYAEVRNKIFDSNTEFEYLITGLCSHMLYWKEKIHGLEQTALSLTEIAAYIKTIAHQKNTDPEQPVVFEEGLTNAQAKILEELADNVLELFNSMKNCLVNPETQLGAISKNQRLIINGIAGFCERYLGQNNKESSLEQENAKDRQYKNFLMALLLHKTSMCQNGLIGFIHEELMPLSKDNPLQSCWSNYMAERIKNAHNLFLEKFPQEVDALSGLDTGPFLKAVILDSNNVDNQDRLVRAYLPDMPLEDGFRYPTFKSFPVFMANRHLSIGIELLGFPPSVRHHLVYPELFSAGSVEHLIEATQLIYSEISRKLEVSESKQKWLDNCQSQYNTYLSEAYPRETTTDQEIETETETEALSSPALYNAYVSLAQSYQAMYNSDLDLASRQAIAKRAEHAMGEKALEFITQELKTNGVTLPEGFDDWSIYRKRQYLHMNKPAVYAGELDEDMLDSNNENANRHFVSREFAIVVLFSQGLLTERQELHEKIGKIGTSCFGSFYTEEQLRAHGYTKPVL